MTPTALLVVLFAASVYAYPYRGGVKGGSTGGEDTYPAYPEPTEDSGPSLHDRFRDFYDKASEKAKEVWVDTKETVKSAQEKVKDFVDDARGKANEAFRNAKEKTEVYVDNAKEKVTELWQKGVEQIKEVMEDLKNKAKKGKDGVEETRNDRKDNEENVWQTMQGQVPEQVPKDLEVSFEIEPPGVDSDRKWDEVPIKDEPVLIPNEESDKRIGDDVNSDDKNIEEESRKDKSIGDDKVILDVAKETSIGEGGEEKSWDNKDEIKPGDKPIGGDDQESWGQNDDNIPDGDKEIGGDAWKDKDEIKPILIGDKPGVSKEEIIPQGEKENNGGDAWKDKDEVKPILIEDKPGMSSEEDAVQILVDDPAFPPWDSDDSWNWVQHSYSGYATPGHIETDNDQPQWRPKY